MSTGAVTIRPAPRKRIDITAGELLDALVAYLRQAMNTEVGRVEFEASRLRSMALPAQQSTFSKSTRTGTPSPRDQGTAKYAAVHLLRHRGESLGTPQDEQGLRTVADVIAEPNEDRSITFTPRKPQRYHLGRHIYKRASP
jgi:hypothetical protein